MNQYGQNILGKKGYIAEGLFTQAEIDDMARWSLCPRQIKLLLRSRLLLSLVR